MANLNEYFRELDPPIIVDDLSESEQLNYNLSSEYLIEAAKYQFNRSKFLPKAYTTRIENQTKAYYDLPGDHCDIRLWQVKHDDAPSHLNISFRQYYGHLDDIFNLSFKINPDDTVNNIGRIFTYSPAQLNLARYLLETAFPITEETYLTHGRISNAILLILTEHRNQELKDN